MTFPGRVTLAGISAENHLADFAAPAADVDAREGSRGIHPDSLHIVVEGGNVFADSLLNGFQGAYDAVFPEGEHLLGVVRPAWVA